MKSPYAKLFVVACISFGVLGPSSVLYVAIAGVGYLCWTVLAGVPVTGFLRRIRSGLVFFAVIIVVNALTRNGRVIFDIGGLYVTAEGVIEGMGQALRLIMMLWGGFLLVSSTRLEEFLDAGEMWTRQKGRPLLSAGTIAICYMPVLIESAKRISIARRARGESDLPGLFSGIARAGKSALPLFASALRNADSLAEAMESRCYDPRLPRSRFRLTTVSWPDVACILFAFGITAAAFSRIL